MLACELKKTSLTKPETTHSSFCLMLQTKVKIAKHRKNMKLIIDFKGEYFFYIKAITINYKLQNNTVEECLSVYDASTDPRKKHYSEFYFSLPGIFFHSLNGG